jgi:hypothetical protein
MEEARQAEVSSNIQRLVADSSTEQNNSSAYGTNQNLGSQQTTTNVDKGGKTNRTSNGSGIDDNYD